MSKSKKRRRRGRRLSLIVTAAVLALALLGLGLWIALDRSPGTVMRTYPMEYESLIRIYSEIYEIPPAYTAAVILAESAYDPEAVSSANAQGLMQLLPPTAEWIAERLGDVYREGSLFDPETNIHYGCWYLGFLMKRYNGDMRCASSAYHQGQGTVDKWLSDPRYSPDGATLAVIPSNTTDTYVQRVLKYYEKYAEKYAAAEPAVMSHNGAVL